jgi:hypothetical protein
VRSNILEKYPSSTVRVYVVWFDMMPGDSRNLVDRKVFNDRRATNFYDAGRVVGSWFAQRSGDSGGIVWDAYFLYGRDAAWSSTPGPLISSGGDVIGAGADLAAAFAKIA